MTTPGDTLPAWMRKWMLFTAGVFFLDGLFCVLRPHTLTGGCLASLYYVYGIYIRFDKHYADTDDSFIFAQGIGSLIEATVHIAVLCNVLGNPRWTKLLTLVANVMVAWKTTLFDLYSLDIPLGGPTSDHHWLPTFLVVYASSWLWICIPAYAAWTMAKDVLKSDSKRQ